MRLTEDILRRQFGFNDPNVIRNILNNPAEVARYEREAGLAPKSPQDLAREQADAILKATEKQRQDEMKFLEQYTQDNPFVFDEELARQSAKAEYSPYYTELLQDYLDTADLKRQTVEDERGLLEDLNKIDTATRSREYERAVSQAEEGFAGKGLFFSGIKARGTGQIENEYMSDEERIQRGMDSQRGGLDRQETALDMEEGQNRRDLGRQEQEAVESGILQRKSESQKQYYTPLTQSYFRRFPSGSSSSLQGYVVPEYLRH